MCDAIKCVFDTVTHTNGCSLCPCVSRNCTHTQNRETVTPFGLVCKVEIPAEADHCRFDFQNFKLLSNAWIISTLYGDNYTELKRKQDKSVGTADSFLLPGVVEGW